MEIGRQCGLVANEHITVGNNRYGKVKTFKYLDYLLANQKSIYGEIKWRLRAENVCYYSAETFLSPRILSQRIRKLKYVKQ